MLNRASSLELKYGLITLALDSWCLCKYEGGDEILRQTQDVDL